MKANLDKNLAPAWVSGKSYSTGEFCLYNKRLYICITDNSDVEFNISKWEIRNLVDLVSGINSNLYDKECGDGTTKKCVSGSFVCDGVVPKTIKCGFKPSHITMHVYRNDLNVTYTTLLVYDGDINPDKMYRSGGSGAVAENLATQITLNDDGFTINNIRGNQTSNSYTTKWVAYE